MNPRVKKVTPLPGYQLRLIFNNGEERIFDTTPFLDKGVFRELKSPELFNTVRVYLGSISWENGQDLCPDTLYMESIPITHPQRKKRIITTRKHLMRK